MRFAYVDETKHRGYVLVAAVLADHELSVARTLIRDLLKPGQRRLHMKNESDGRKETIAKALVVAGMRANVYDAGRHYRTQLAARRACLGALVDDLARSEAETVIILDLDESLVQSDRKTLYTSIRQSGTVRLLRYEHRRAVADPLLAIPDAFAWCWAKGARWRSHIAPAVTTRFV